MYITDFIERDALALLRSKEITVRLFHVVGENTTFQNAAIGASHESSQLEVERVLRQTNLHAEGSIGAL